MSSMLDMIGSTILFGVFMLVVSQVNGNMSSTMYQNTFSLETQEESVFLARMIESDLTKVGYGVTGQKIFVADSTCVAFKAASVSGGPVDSISYSAGSADTTTMNLSDFRFIRYAKKGGAISERIGMTLLKFSYYDSLNTLIPTPVTGTAKLAAIRAIRVKYRLESFEPATNLVTGDTSYNASYYAVTWDKLIYPRNLGKPF